MNIAVFDVDGTLLDGDCLLLAARRSRTPLGCVGAAFICFPWLIAWKFNLISAKTFKERFLSVFRICEKVNREESALKSDWLLQTLKKKLKPQALKRLREHQRKGERVVLCSASPRMLIQPLADWLGVDLVCSELQRVNNLWQPRLASLNCNGKEKVLRLEMFLGKLDLLTIEAYGDSIGDKELLQISEVPHFRSFNPSPSPYRALPPFLLLPLAASALLVYGLLGVWSQGDSLVPLISRLWLQIICSLLLVLLGYLIRFFRWRVLLNSVNLSPPMLTDARIWMSSYAFTATPGKSGEAVRSFMLKEQCGLPIQATLMSLLVERLTDGIAVLILLAINFSLVTSTQIQFFTIFVGLLGIIFTLVVLLRGSFFRSQIFQIAHRLLPKSFEQVGREGLHSLRCLLTPATLLFTSTIASFAWFLEGLSLWILLKGMDEKFLTIGGATIAHTAAGLLGALTLLPGGLGSTEAGTVALLSLQNVPLSIATPATLLIRILTLWLATFLGVICLLLPFKSR